jgi:hypothetical protein
MHSVLSGAPATMNDEGLADVGAASPFRLPRLHPGDSFRSPALQWCFDMRTRLGPLEQGNACPGVQGRARRKEPSRVTQFSAGR